jgi:hypothetical protein
MRKAILGLSFLVPVVAFVAIVLYAIYFPPPNSTIGWPIIYGSLVLGAVLAALAQRTYWLKFVVAAVYLAVAYLALAASGVFIACHVFGDCL